MWNVAKADYLSDLYPSAKADGKVQLKQIDDFVQLFNCSIVQLKAVTD